MKSFHMYTIAVTGGRFRPTPITVLLERGEGFFRVSRSHTLENSRSKELRQAQTIFRQTQTDASRLTVSLVDVTQSLDNNISPPKLIWSGQPRCWPRPID